MKSRHSQIVEILWIDDQWIDYETWLDAIQSNWGIFIETFETSSR